MKLHQLGNQHRPEAADVQRTHTGIVFEQLEVVFVSTTKSGGYDLGTFSIHHHLRLWV
ncbi:MAG: hypothetical protein U0X87_16525 [Anaerolineales bacterium]